MRLSDFDYHLPPDLIAQYPLKDRDKSRLLVLNRSGGIEHRYFYELTQYLDSGDVLVVNNTKVIPARLTGLNEAGTKVEFLIFEGIGDGTIWKALARPSKKAKKGSRWRFGKGIEAEIIDILDRGCRLLSFKFEGDFLKALEKIGQIPLPPYIKREVEDLDRECYQTIYAYSPGSCAAPTAGLHFTKKLLDEISLKGVKIVPITLHVGPGTFLSIRTEVVEDHKMWPEYYEVSQEAAKILKDTEGRIIAVGTTTLRTLETVAGLLTACHLPPTIRGWTDLFIYPGFEFKIVDALITNFHLPRSSPLILVAAFAGRERILAAYEEAIKEKYRFYSYGDAMLIL